MDLNYKNRYKKYKIKYLALKEQIAGQPQENIGNNLIDLERPLNELSKAINTFFDYIDCCNSNIKKINNKFNDSLFNYVYNQEQKKYVNLLHASFEKYKQDSESLKVPISIDNTNDIVSYSEKLGNRMVDIATSYNNFINTFYKNIKGSNIYAYNTEVNNNSYNENEFNCKKLNINVNCHLLLASQAITRMLMPFEALLNAVANRGIPITKSLLNNLNTTKSKLSNVNEQVRSSEEYNKELSCTCKCKKDFGSIKL
jgi:hypothetical protein